jgi:hypothetical protein
VQRCSEGPAGDPVSLELCHKNVCQSLFSPFFPAGLGTEYSMLVVVEDGAVIEQLSLQARYVDVT